MKQRWGEGIFYLSVAVSMLVLALKPAGFHYAHYVAVSPLFWAGQDPYGMPGIINGYLHPPIAGLFFYGAFSWLPLRLGQWVYTATCLIVFVVGWLRLLRLLKDHGYAQPADPLLQFVWLMFSSEVVGAIGATKADLLTTGVVFWVASRVLAGRGVFTSFLVLGSVLSVKLQPLSTAVLLALADVFARRRATSFMALAAAMVFWNALPFVFLDPTFVIKVNQHWVEYLGAVTERIVHDSIFQQIFRLYEVWTSQRIAYAWLNPLILCGAAVTGFIYIFLSAPTRGNQTRSSWSLESIVLALVLGSGFAVLFAPLIQSNSYCLYLPLPLGMYLLARGGLIPLKLTVALLGILYFFVSLVYSDLVPRVLRVWCFDHATKPAAVLVAFVILIGWFVVQRLRRARLATAITTSNIPTGFAP